MSSGVPTDFLEAQFQRLVGIGLSETIARTIVGLYRTGTVAPGDFDMDAFKALHAAPTQVSLQALAEFGKLDLSIVQHKSAYLCGMIKNLTDHQRRGSFRARYNVAAAAENQPSFDGADSVEMDNSNYSMPRTNARSTYTAEKVIAEPTLAHMHGRGPDPKRLKDILTKVPYTVEVTAGHRKYSAPEDEDVPPAQSSGLEVFICRIPRDAFEDELFPIFERCGKILQIRIMVDVMTGWTRGFGFCKFATKEAANRAVRKLDEYEMRNGRRIGVSVSLNNQRLFVSNIPKNKDRDELAAEFSKHSPGLVQVIVYTSPDDRKKNRGFCFLDYENHRLATIAKRKFSTGRIRIWNCDIIVDWADPLEEPDEEVMSKVKVLYVRNLTQRVTEEELKQAFQAKGAVERVKKIKDYAFVHFSVRDDAAKAMAELNGVEIGGAPMEITWAKPPSDKRKKEEVLRKREVRMSHLMYNRGRYWNPNIYGNERPPHYMVGGPATAGISFTGFTPAMVGNRFSGNFSSNSYAANSYPTSSYAANSYATNSGSSGTTGRAVYNNTPSQGAGLLGNAPKDIYATLANPNAYAPPTPGVPPYSYTHLMTNADYWDDFNDLDMTCSPLSPAAVPVPNNPGVPLPPGFGPSPQAVVGQLAHNTQGAASASQAAAVAAVAAAAAYGYNQSQALYGQEYDYSVNAAAAYYAGGGGGGVHQGAAYDYAKYQQLQQLGPPSPPPFQYPYYY
jgi:Q family heterogeneous nuclear ribonucleoprotein R